MLLTERTASAGITLTRANHILCVSPVGSRDLEIQMIGRSYRLGQTKPVYFRRYAAVGTIEEAMLEEARVHGNGGLRVHGMRRFLMDHVVHARMQHAIVST